MIGLISCIGLLALLTYGTWKYPAVAFAGVLCLFGIKQWGQSTSEFFAHNRTLVNLAIGCLVILGLIRSWSNLRSSATNISPVWVLIQLLYVYAVITFAWVPNLTTVIDQWVAWAPYVLTVSFLAPFLIRGAEDVRCFSMWTVLVGGVVCLLAVFYGNWGYRGLILQGEVHADVANETNPLALATLGATVAVIGMVSSFSNFSFFKRLFFIFMIPLGVAVVLRTGSRGQVICMGIAMLVGAPMATRKRNIGGLVFLAAGFVLLGALSWWIWHQTAYYDDVRWSGDRSAEDVAGRIQMAVTLMSAAVSKPAYLIAGLGNSRSFAILGIYPHIAGLEILAEEGLVGFSLYIAILIFTFSSVRKLWVKARISQDVDLQYSVAVLTALFLFEFFLTYKQGTLLSSIYAFAYASVLGLLAKRAGVEPGKNPDHVRLHQEHAPAKKFNNILS
jgi:hypothetical protein